MLYKILFKYNFFNIIDKNRIKILKVGDYHSYSINLFYFK